MSRWKNELAAIKNTWNDLKAESKKLPNQVGQEGGDEISRLHKAIAYIGELLQNADAELIPYHVVEKINGNVKKCISSIETYLQSPTPLHLKNANTNIDNALIYTSPYVFIEHKAKAATVAFMADIGVASEQVKKLHDEAQSAVTDIRKNKGTTDKAIGKIEETETSAQGLAQKALKSAGDASKSANEIETIRAQAEQQHNKIESYHKNLTAGDNSIVSQIDSAKAKIANKLAAVEQETSDLHNFHGEIFGTEEKEGEGKQGGLNQKIKERKLEFDALIEKAEGTFSLLEKQINNQLLTATSGRLAKAFLELKEKAESEVKNNTRVFYVSLALLGILPVLGPSIDWFISLFSTTNAKIAATTWYDNILNNLPYLGPLVWLALFSAKRRSEARRLQEEYAHKEALANSYMGYKEQAEKLEAEGEKTLAKQLLESAIKAISFNASTTLDKKHGDKTPIHEAAASAADKLTLKAKKD